MNFKKNLIISAILLIYVLGFWLFYQNVIAKQPAQILSLNEQIAEKKRQLLSAQIISRDLQNVNELINNNLVSDLSDSLARPADMGFLKYLTGLMDSLGIVLISVKPMGVVRSSGLADTSSESSEKASRLSSSEYIQTPYSLVILASYAQFGSFLEQLEKSPRLIRVIRFQLENPIDVTYYEQEISGKPEQHRINLDIQTLTILKASYAGG